MSLRLQNILKHSKISFPALMKLTRAADVSTGSRVRTICLPPFETPLTFNSEKTSPFFFRPEPPDSVKRKPKPPKPNPDTAVKYLEKLNNLTNNIFSGFTKKHKNMKYNVRVANESNKTDKKEEVRKSDADSIYDSASLDSVVKLIKNKHDGGKSNNDRSDKKLMFGEEIDPFIDDNGIDFKDECYTTGWGREHTNGNLTNVLLEAEVPVLPLQLCRDRYSLTLPLNEGHLCAGSTDGSTGACVVRFICLSTGTGNTYTSILLQSNFYRIIELGRSTNVITNSLEFEFT